MIKKMKKGEAVLIKEGRESVAEIEITPKNGKNFGLQELYDLLDCDLVQVVYLGDDAPNNIMIVDEESKLKEGAQLNLLGSVYFNHQFGMLADQIVGKAIMCHTSMFK